MPKRLVDATHASPKAIPSSLVKKVGRPAVRPSSRPAVQHQGTLALSDQQQAGSSRAASSQ